VPNTYAPPPGPAPPSYTTSRASPTSPTAKRPSSASTADDPYTFLSTFDTIFLIDDSTSMSWNNSWTETATALAAITPICTTHDTDGIDIFFLNAPTHTCHRNITTSSQVLEIFQTVQPKGSTPTGQRLQAILRPYIKELEAVAKRGGVLEEEVKPMNLIVITDGAPSDDVESVIVSVAKKLDLLDAVAWQVGIQFFQVGREPGAAEHLASLDDDLERIGGGCRDIVDTVPMADGAALSGEGILKTVLGAVNKRLDRASL